MSLLGPYPLLRKFTYINHATFMDFWWELRGRLLLYKWKIHSFANNYWWILRKMYFSKFYGKVGIISWLLFHLIWKKLRSKLKVWDFEILYFFLLKENSCTFLIFNNCQYISNHMSIHYLIELSCPHLCSQFYFLLLEIWISHNHVTMYSLLDEQCSKSG